jgi:hypothetical protein
MSGLYVLVLALAVPIVVVVSIVRRVKQISSRLADPTRLQKAFAESAAAALRRAGTDPQSLARLETYGVRDSALDPDSEPEPIPLPHPGRGLQRPRRARVMRSGPVSFEMGDRFRLSEPPEIHEPHGPIATGANWLVFAALAGAAAYYLLR